MSNNLCSGLCLAGYFCNTGSTSNNAVPCGMAAGGYLDNQIAAAQFYCPAGTSIILNVDASRFTIPEDQLYAHRSDDGGLYDLKKGKTCIAGIKYPSLQWSGFCAGASTVAEVDAVNIGGLRGTLRVPGKFYYIFLSNKSKVFQYIYTYRYPFSNDRY